MTVSSVLEIPLLTEAMAQKSVAANMALQALEKAIAGVLDVDTSAVTYVNYEVVVPFDETNDLSSRLALRAIYYRLTAGAGFNFRAIHPNNQHLFIVENLTAYNANVRVLIGGTNVDVPPGAIYLLYCDGANVKRINFSVPNLTQAHDFDCYFWGAPATSQTIARLLVGRQTTFPANFAGSIGKVGVPPVSTRTLTVRADSGPDIGYISIAATTGVVTFSTLSGVAKTIFVGDHLNIINQAGAPDPNMTDLEFVLLGTIVVAQPIP